MKKIALLTFLSISLFLGSCSKSSVDPGDINPPTTTDGNVTTVSSDITANTTWKADKIYLLKGKIYVTNNAVLTIEPGTIIKGDKVSAAALIITRGARIEAVGTADKPIVFTSNVGAGGRKEGDWGGLVLLGKATNNIGTNVPIEGISDATDKAKHGGTIDNDNSGTLKYVRIEYAGIPLGADNELNGLTFGSVGSGTTVDYVEVYRSGDDAYEWFGGTVNCKHLLAIDTWDDDFDTDNGYSGRVQFGLAQRLAATADVSGSNGFESDNNSAGTDAVPQTSAVFSNMTILGPRENAPGTTGLPSINANFQHAAQIRRNSSISIGNSVFTGYPEGIFFDDAAPGVGVDAKNSSNNLLADKAVFANNLIYSANSKGNQIKATAGTVNGNTVLANITAKLTVNNIFTDAFYAIGVYTDPYKFSADIAPAVRAGVPNFTQIATSPALVGAAFTGKFASGFEVVAYKGAFGTTDWSAGWASYSPQTLPYTTPGAVK